MQRFFNEQAPVKTVHVVGMTQYYTHNFAEPTAPDYVSTYDITSCVVVLIKNLDDTKTCSHFGMAHINLANVYDEVKAKENLDSFINDFINIGGNLATASIQLMGGLIVDANQVREKVGFNLVKIAKEKGIDNLNIKVPETFKVDTAVDSGSTGNGQVMMITCDKKGTYMRKVTFQKGQIVAKTYYPPNCELMSDANVKRVMPPIDKAEYDRLKTRTHNFQVQTNQLLSAKPDQTSPAYIATIKQINESYCTMEKSVYAGAQDQKQAVKQV